MKKHVNNGIVQANRYKLLFLNSNFLRDINGNLHIHIACSQIFPCDIEKYVIHMYMVIKLPFFTNHIYCFYILHTFSQLKYIFHYSFITSIGCMVSEKICGVQTKDFIRNSMWSATFTFFISLLWNIFEMAGV